MSYFITYHSEFFYHIQQSTFIKYSRVLVPHTTVSTLITYNCEYLVYVLLGGGV